MNDVEKKLKNFSDLLDDINTLDDKRKQLWREIYQNAISDRQDSYANYTVLMELCGRQSSEHAIHGRTMVSYLERMSRANDQLIKLADLVERAKSEAGGVSKDDLYTQINKK